MPEGRRIFARLTVRRTWRWAPTVRKDENAIAQDMERVFTLFPRLKERRQVAARCRAVNSRCWRSARLMANPRVLLLDEPSMGLAPILVEEIFDIIRHQPDGTTILLVEQNALMALSIADRGYVLQTGEIVLQDTAENLQERDGAKGLPGHGINRQVAIINAQRSNLYAPPRFLSGGPNMLILTADDVRKALPIRDAYRSDEKRLRFPLRRESCCAAADASPVPAAHEGLIIFMPAYVQRQRPTKRWPVKIVSLFPGNPGGGPAFIQAPVLVLEADTGRALALLDGSSLTAIRTGVGSGVAIGPVVATRFPRYWPSLGRGHRAAPRSRAACTVRKIETVWIFDADSSPCQSPRK